MKQLQTKAIVLARLDYGEADRILTLLTPTQGKLRLMARGVRRVKSKLAGGIELFSISDITFVRGRGEIGTLVSARLAVHYGSLATDYERTMLGFECIKRLHKLTEDEPEPEYFEALCAVFETLNDPASPLTVVKLWFGMRMLQLGGHTPNLTTDPSAKPLLAQDRYAFDSEAMAFSPAQSGPYTAAHVKALRLAASSASPADLARVGGSDQAAQALLPLIETMLRAHLRV